MGHTGARYLAAVCAGLLTFPAEAQYPAPAQRVFDCALQQVQTTYRLPEPADNLAVAAIWSDACKPDMTALMLSMGIRGAEDQAAILQRKLISKVVELRAASMAAKPKGAPQP